MATYAIGDVQGCLTPLKCLLEKIQFNTDKDQLWFCGDLINRGPDSLDTLRFIYERRENVVAVLGNHDLHLLAVAAGHNDGKSKDTLSDILDAPDRYTLLNWLRFRPLIHHDAAHNAILVHAGIPPIWTLDKALSLAQEVENILQSNRCDDYLGSMYGNKPARWSKKLEAPERWRVITNYLTRMRFCKDDGTLDLTTKEGASSAPKGYAPWFKHSNKLNKNLRVIFGHWAALMGETKSDRFIGLDTGCVWGGALTAYCLETGEHWSCDCD